MAYDHLFVRAFTFLSDVENSSNVLGTNAPLKHYKGNSARQFSSKNLMDCYKQGAEHFSWEDDNFSRGLWKKASTYWIWNVVENVGCYDVACSGGCQAYCRRKAFG